MIQNIKTFIPKFKTLNLYLKCLELNGLIFRCAEHSQVFQTPVGQTLTCIQETGCSHSIDMETDAFLSHTTEMVPVLKRLLRN